MILCFLWCGLGDRPEFTRRSILSALHGQAAFRPAGSMAAPAPPQDLVGAMAQTQDPLSKARRTGSENGACPQGDRHRPKGLVERRRLAHARRHNQSVTGAMGSPELARSDSAPVAALLNRRVRSRTHGGVGGREGRPSLPPDPLGRLGTCDSITRADLPFAGHQCNDRVRRGC